MGAVEESPPRRVERRRSLERDGEQRRHRDRPRSRSRSPVKRRRSRSPLRRHSSRSPQRRPSSRSRSRERPRDKGARDRRSDREPGDRERSGRERSGREPTDREDRGDAHERNGGAAERGSRGGGGGQAGDPPRRLERESDGAPTRREPDSGRGGHYGSSGGGGGGGGGGERAQQERGGSRRDGGEQQRRRDGDDNGRGAGGGKDEGAGQLAVEVKPDFGVSGKLAAETNEVNGVVMKFQPPPEARRCTSPRWRLYVFKGEQQVGEPLPLDKFPFFLFGKERRVADVPTDHPSCSRQHAVIVFREVERASSLARVVVPYIIDLETVNGTFVNGERIEASRYVELLERDVIRFGLSSREYVLLNDKSVG